MEGRFLMSAEGRNRKVAINARFLGPALHPPIFITYQHLIFRILQLIGAKHFHCFIYCIWGKIRLGNIKATLSCEEKV